MQIGYEEFEAHCAGLVMIGSLLRESTNGVYAITVLLTHNSRDSDRVNRSCAISCGCCYVAGLL